MLVRIKKTVGTYGLQVGCAVRPVTHASGAFEVSEAKAQELLQRGIVDVVEAATPAPAPVAQEPEQQDLSALSVKELRAIATERGVKWTAKTGKAELIKLIEHA